MITLRDIKDHEAVRDDYRQVRDRAVIACLGDSITGWNTTSPNTSEWPNPVYPTYLENTLKNRGVLDGEIANFGIQGLYATDMPALARDAISLLPNLKTIIMLAGSNDIGSNENIAQTSQRVIESFTEVSSLLSAKRINLIMLNIPPLNIHEEGMEHLAQAVQSKRAYHNTKLEEFCRARRIPLVDIFSKMTQVHFTGSYEDRFHPNEQGARLIASHLDSQSIFASR